MVELNIPRCRELIAELRDLPNDYIAYAEELCPEAADQLEAALAEIERTRRKECPHLGCEICAANRVNQAEGG